MSDTLHRANARSRRVPAIIFRVLLAWVISGIALAVAVPALHAQGIEIRGWMIWAVILASLALCVAPDVLARRRDQR